VSKNIGFPETFKVQGHETKLLFFFIPDSTNEIDVNSLSGILNCLPYFSVKLKQLVKEFEYVGLKKIKRHNKNKFFNIFIKDKQQY
tara:strand:+ start:350 stop:607 length:258 start_codon:yes stop_codon:yes gene_type:complete